LEDVQELHIKLEEEETSLKVSLSLGYWDSRKKRVRQASKNSEYVEFLYSYIKSELYIKGIPIYREEGRKVVCSTSYLNPSLHNKLGLGFE